MTQTTILWFRQDLRLADQAAVSAAANEGRVVPVYVLDDQSPGAWAMGAAQRWWLHHSIDALAHDLEEQGAPLILRRGDSVDEIVDIATRVGATRVHAIRHYEPWWKDAESRLSKSLELVLHDGNQLANPADFLTGQGNRYRMFTPFWRSLSSRMPPPHPHHAPSSIEGSAKKLPGDKLSAWKLLPTRPNWSKGFDVWTPGEDGARDALDHFVPHLADYDVARNMPSIEGTSRLSPHLHFGEISPATVWHRLAGKPGAWPYLREVAWRDFTTNIIDCIPGYADANGREAFDKISWRTGKAADADFDAWTKGRTGYPIVDAGMRELWATGWMHNRVRMIVASFLTKHLLIDWRRGERWFWDTLIDADYGNNSVNWQWVAGTGIDSNPFGRIMAPLSQSAKFDAAAYIRQWVPELEKMSERNIHDPHDARVAPPDYAQPLIGHGEGRARALEAYARTKSPDR